MKEMIDALLGLAQVSRAELELEKIDLAHVAAEIVQELRQTSPDRKVGVDVQGPLRVCGDRRLLTIAMDNLIRNAWKFTSASACARIAIGKEERGAETIFFVKDNGVGFDMGESEKLFAAFQRLHTSAEFAGYGIGLANVRKIIVRHGGRIWAESAPGRGAIFRFTLAAPPD
jgi:light-regulated signal transduction histidine kinase (bacteriophytochrome)